MAEPADDEPGVARDVTVLTRGSRLALTVAAVFVVVAAAAFWMPIERVAPPAPPVSCGSAASPSHDQAVMTLCGDKPRQHQLLAAAALAVAVVVAAGGVWSFGTSPARVRPASRPG